MSNIIAAFKMIMIMMLFYSVAITGLLYAMPNESINYVYAFSDVSNEINIEGITSEMEESLLSQTEIPIVEFGALVFYSGNLIIDLLLNFIFAIPEMIGLLVNGLMLLFNIDSYAFALVEMFAAAATTVFYLFGIIQLTVGLRSGQGIL